MQASIAPAPHVRATFTLDTLPSLHRYLVETFATPPSLPTLKRWSAAGALRAAHSVFQGTRASRAKDAKGGEMADSKPRYNRAKAVEIISRLWELGNQKTPQPRMTGRADSPGHDPQPLQPTTDPSNSNPDLLPNQALGPSTIQTTDNSLLTALLNKLDENTRAVTELSQAVSRLDGVRKVLAVKYDTVNAQQAVMIDELRARLTLLKGNDAVAQEIQSIRIRLNSLLDKMNSG